MSTSKSVPALRFSGVTKMFAHQGGQKLLRQRLLELIGPPQGQRFIALENITFELAHGETMGLIGSNGSGKSTLLNLATNLALPDSGEIFVEGRVAAMLELGAGFHQDLTGAENLRIHAAMMGLTRQQTHDRFDEIVAFSGITDFIHDPLRTYSSGMIVRLAFAIMVHTDPDVVLLDEVMGMGDQAFYHQALELIRTLQRQGKTMILASHSLELITMLCQKALWLEKGRVVQFGDARSVVAAYQAGSSQPASA